MKSNSRRTQRDYSLAFKLEVVDQVEKGEFTYKQAQDHYGIQGCSTVLVWLRKHGRLNWTDGTPKFLKRGDCVFHSKSFYHGLIFLVVFCHSTFCHDASFHCFSNPSTRTDLFEARLATLTAPYGTYLDRGNSISFCVSARRYRSFAVTLL